MAFVGYLHAQHGLGAEHTRANLIFMAVLKRCVLITDGRMTKLRFRDRKPLSQSHAIARQSRNTEVGVSLLVLTQNRLE